MSFRSPGTWGVMLLVAVLAGYLIERLIVTDAEAIEALLERAVAAVDHGDFDVFRDTIDEEYSQDGRDRDGIVKFVSEEYRHWRPSGLRLDVLEVKVTGDEAEARIALRARDPGGRVLAEVHLVRRAGGWRIRAARPTSILPYGIR
jgi:hypothetical protein